MIITQPGREIIAMVTKSYILTDQDTTIILNFNVNTETLSQISGSISMAVR